MKTLIIVLAIFAYLIIGFIFYGAIPASDGEPIKSMVILWVFYIPILAVSYAILGAFGLAIKLGKSLRNIFLSKK